MATDINQYKNCHPYSAPKKVGKGETMKGEQPISYNNKAEGETVKEQHPISYNSKGVGKTTNEEQPI